MAELPEYKQKERITPAAAPGGQHEAISGMKQGWDAVAAISSQAASNSAHKYAKEAALLDAQNPGKEFSPLEKAMQEMTGPGQTYRQTYAEESSKVILNDAAVGMDKLAYEFGSIENPTLTHFNQWNESAQQLLEQKASEADPLAASEVKRRLRLRYSTDVVNNADKVNKADTKRKLNTSIVRSSDNLKDLYNLGASGNFDGMKETFTDELKNIKGREDTAGKALTEQSIQNLSAAYYGSQLQAQLLAAMKENGNRGGAAFLQAIRAHDFTKDGIDITEADKATLIPQLTKKYLETAKENGLNDARDLQKAAIETVENNGVLPNDRWNHYNNLLSESSMNKLKLFTMKKNKESMDISRITNFANENSENEIALGNLTGKEKNALFEDTLKNYYGDKPTMENRADTAKLWAMPCSAFTDPLNRGMLANNPDVAAAAAQMHRAFELSHPASISKGISPKAAKRAEGINARMLAGLSGAEAVEDYDNKVLGMSEKSQEKRDGLYDQALTDRRLKNDEVMLNYISDRIGVSEELIRHAPEAIADWEKLHKLSYNHDGDFDAASTFADKNLLRTWSTTYINGVEQFMKYAPGMYYPEEEVGSQLGESLVNVVNANKEAHENPDIPIRHYYEFDKKQIDRAREGEAIFYGGIGPHGPREKFVPDATPTLIRINSLTGEKQYGKAVITSDDHTSMPQKGKGLSYVYMWYPNDGGIPQKIGIAIKTKKGFRIEKGRFTVDEERIDKQRAYTEKEQALWYEQNKESYEAMARVRGIVPSKKDPIRWALMAIAKHYPKAIPKDSKFGILGKVLPKLTKDKE